MLKYSNILLKKTSKTHFRVCNRFSYFGGGWHPVKKQKTLFDQSAIDLTSLPRSFRRTQAKMNNISDVVIKPLQKSIYMKPQTMEFVHNGQKRHWDLLTIHDSVIVVLYNKTRNVLVFVKQFRPPVYLGNIPESDRQGHVDVNKYPGELGITIELCAGIVDKNLSLSEITAEEILEECGYKVDASKLKEIASYRTGVGTMGSIQTMFYCELTDDMKVNLGGGVHDEIIEVVEMTVPEVREYITQKNILSPPSLLFGITWFLLNVADKN